MIIDLFCIERQRVSHIGFILMLLCLKLVNTHLYSSMYYRKFVKPSSYYILGSVLQLQRWQAY